MVVGPNFLILSIILLFICTGAVPADNFVCQMSATGRGQKMGSDSLEPDLHMFVSCRVVLKIEPRASEGARTDLNH